MSLVCNGEMPSAPTWSNNLPRDTCERHCRTDTGMSVMTSPGSVYAQALLSPCICIFLYISANLFFPSHLLPFLRCKESDRCCQDTEKFVWVYGEDVHEEQEEPLHPSSENQHCKMSLWRRNSLSWGKSAAVKVLFPSCVYRAFSSGCVLDRPVLPCATSCGATGPERPTPSRTHRNEENPPRKAGFTSLWDMTSKKTYFKGGYKYGHSLCTRSPVEKLRGNRHKLLLGRF